MGILQQSGTHLVARNPMINGFTKWEFSSHLIKNPRLCNTELIWQHNVIKGTAPFCSLPFLVSGFHPHYLKIALGIRSTFQAGRKVKVKRPNGACRSKLPFFKICLEAALNDFPYILRQNWVTWPALAIRESGEIF